jgi:hypothetical protein
MAAPSMRLRPLLPDATYNQLLTRGLRRSFKHADFGEARSQSRNSSKRCWALYRESTNVVQLKSQWPILIDNCTMFSRGAKRGPHMLRIVAACRDIARLNEKPIALLALRPVSAVWSLSRLFNLVRVHQSKMQSLALTASACRATCQARQASNYLLPLRQAKQVLVWKQVLV